MNIVCYVQERMVNIIERGAKMSRLTKEEILNFPKTTYGRALGKTIASKVMNELLQYKDLEEQLGCPLDVVFKALDKGFYIDTKKVEKEPPWENPKERISLVGCPKYFRLNLWYKTIEVDRFGNYLEIWLKDYKKTWWLKKDKSE